MEMSNYLEAALFNAVFRNTAYTSPAAVYVALHSADPTDTGANELAEVNGYARQAVTFGAPTAGAGTSTNAPAFTASGGNWGSVTHFSIWDASTGGNMLLHSPMDISRTVNDGATLTFAIGDIDPSMGGAMSTYLANALYDAVLRNTTYTSPVTVYVSLHTADPAGTGANELAVANGYAREAVAFPAPTDGVATNSGVVAFTASGASWGTISHFGIADASAAGNALVDSALDAAQPVGDGDTLNWAIGALTASMA